MENVVYYKLGHIVISHRIVEKDGLFSHRIVEKDGLSYSIGGH